MTRRALVTPDPRPVHRPGPAVLVHRCPRTRSPTPTSTRRHAHPAGRPVPTAARCRCGSTSIPRPRTFSGTPRDADAGKLVVTRDRHRLRSGDEVPPTSPSRSRTSMTCRWSPSRHPTSWRPSASPSRSVLTRTCSPTPTPITATRTPSAPRWRTGRRCPAGSRSTPRPSPSRARPARSRPVGLAVSVDRHRRARRQGCRHLLPGRRPGARHANRPGRRHPTRAGVDRPAQLATLITWSAGKEAAPGSCQVRRSRSRQLCKGKWGKYKPLRDGDGSHGSRTSP